MQLYQNKEKIAEHIAAEGGRDAVAKVSGNTFGLCICYLRRPDLLYAGATRTLPSSAAACGTYIHLCHHGWMSWCRYKHHSMTACALQIKSMIESNLSTPELAEKTAA